jgi:hypothetical protein
MLLALFLRSIPGLYRRMQRATRQARRARLLDAGTTCGQRMTRRDRRNRAGLGSVMTPPRRSDVGTCCDAKNMRRPLLFDRGCSIRNNDGRVCAVDEA